MVLPLIAGGLSFGKSLLGGHMSSRAAVKNFARQHGAAVYSSTFNKLRIDQRNIDTQQIFAKKLELTREQKDFNATAAGQAYENEDRKLNAMFDISKWAREDLQQSLLDTIGKQAARSGGVGSSRSRDRADMLNSVGKFGQEQAKITASLASERIGSKLRKAGIGNQHLSSDFQAWAQTAIAPRLEWGGPAARMGSTAHLQGSPLSLLSAGLGAAQGYMDAGGTFGQPKPPSDIELKRDIQKIGKSPDGHNVYKFKYRHSEGEYIGVMAQELLTKNPEAVVYGDNGYLAVDYDKIDVNFERVA